MKLSFMWEANEYEILDAQMNPSLELPFTIEGHFR